MMLPFDKERMQTRLCFERPRHRLALLRQVLGSTLALSVLTSCANLAGPDYERPDAPTKSQWSDPQATAVSAEATIRPDWWTNFGDSYLDQLVNRAISDSIDLRVLAARIEVSRASIGGAEAEGLPTVSGTAGADFTKTVTRSTSQPSTPWTDSYQASSSVNWEVDIWGKVRKGVEAQKADFKATEADWRAGYLTLVSDVATTYFQIRQFDEQSDQQRRTLANNEVILGIYQAQHGEGLLANTVVLNQKAEVNRLRRELLDLQRARELAENRLATLLGVPAGELGVPVASLLSSVQIVEVPPGLPSDLISRRPDIIAAEYRVLQAHELVGQARLARLPSFSLTGQAGSSSLELSDLFKVVTLGFSPSLNIPIFDPSLKATVKVNEARTQVAEEEYRRTVLSSFEEVENALVNLASRKEQRKELEAQIKHLAQVQDQTRALLQEGIVSQLEVFENERTLLAARQASLDNHQQILSDTVTLYKALGGGWPKEVVRQASN